MKNTTKMNNLISKKQKNSANEKLSILFIVCVGLHVQFLVSSTWLSSLN